MLQQPVVGIIFTAIAAIVGSVTALIRQVLTDRSKRRIERTESKQDENERLLAEYRQLVAMHKSDAEEYRRALLNERDEHRQDVERLEGEVSFERRRLEKHLKDKELG